MYYKILRTLLILFNYNRNIYLLINKYSRLNADKFLKCDKKNRVLVADLTLSHGEIIPGIVKYLLDLGISSDILITNQKMMERPLEMFNSKRVRVFPISSSDYTKLLNYDLIKDYKRVIFGSARVYQQLGEQSKPLTVDVLPSKITPKPICIEHHLEMVDSEEFEKTIPLGLPIFSEERGIKMVNTHYFGEYKPHKRNKKVRFITAGNIEGNRKNHDILISVVKNLLEKNITNFEIIVIGSGKLDIKDKAVSKKIKCLGRVSYARMYKEISKSDYILALLDSENPLHERYIKDGTSGTYQLVYGFRKPCIIDEKFAIKHGLDDTNSIIYKNNHNFEKALCDAIVLDTEEYNKKIENLKKLSESIYQESQQNLKAIL